MEDRRVVLHRKTAGMARASQVWMDTQQDPETYAIIGAAMAVHSELGCGFLEAVYRAALPIEFERRCILYKPEVSLPIAYKGVMLRLPYRVDFVCASGVLVEVKALDALTNRETAQLLNYLKAAGIRRGLLINFGSTSLQCKRLIWDEARERRA